jgi:hypothetical protein
MGDVQWDHSYVTSDKLYCVYLAPGDDRVREHALPRQLPGNRRERGRAGDRSHGRRSLMTFPDGGSQMMTKLRTAIAMSALVGALGVVLGVGAGSAGASNGQSDLAAVRAATARYHRLDAALDAGYVDLSLCFDHMGEHYGQPASIVDGVLEATEPEALVYATSVTASSSSPSSTCRRVPARCSACRCTGTRDPRRCAAPSKTLRRSIGTCNVSLSLTAVPRVN